MVNALLAVVRVLWAAWLFEIGAVVLIVWGLFEAYGLPAALVAGGIACLAKSFELDLRRDQ